MKPNSALKTGLVLAAAVLCLSAQKFDFKNIDPQEWMEVGKKVADAARPMKIDEEIQLGRSLAARLAGTFGVWQDEAWTEEINLIGRTLVPYCKRSNIKYRFAILDTDEVNAYSAPGGYIFVSKGLLKQTESEAELAGVLGHEIAHVASKDVVREIQKSNIWAAGAQVAIAGTDLSSQQEEALSKLTDASWDQLVVKGLSKQDEFKADQEGANNAQGLGYNPSGLYNFIKRLVPMEKKPGAELKIFFSTHPKPSERAARLKKYYSKKGWKKDSRPFNKEQYQAFKAEHPVS